MAPEILTLRTPLREVAPVEAGQTYVFTTPLLTRAGHVHSAGTLLTVVDSTLKCPHAEISATGRNWICRTEFGESVWATLEQCISRGLLRLVPPAKELS